MQEKRCVAVKYTYKCIAFPEASPAIQRPPDIIDEAGNPILPSIRTAGPQ